MLYNLIKERLRCWRAKDEFLLCIAFYSHIVQVLKNNFIDLFLVKNILKFADTCKINYSLSCNDMKISLVQLLIICKIKYVALNGLLKGILLRNILVSSFPFELKLKWINKKYNWILYIFLNNIC